jgi:hypothetical protein
MSQKDLFDLESLPPDGHAKETAWLESVVEWLTNEAACGARFGAFSQSSVPAGFLERTSPVFCRSAVASPAEPSMHFSPFTQNATMESAANALDAMPEGDFLRLIEGEISAVFWPIWQNWGMGSPIAFLTLSGSEWPSAAVVCSLSDVLETGEVPRKYFLSPTACRGILRRSENRGRELPTTLLRELQAGAGSTDQDEDEKTIST